jgi:hypothetical protein
MPQGYEKSTRPPIDVFHTSRTNATRVLHPVHSGLEKRTSSIRGNPVQSRIANLDPELAR